MKIIFISNFYYPFIGGAEEVCRMEAERMSKKGHSVSVITTSPFRYRNRMKIEKVSGVKIYRIAPSDLKFKKIRYGSRSKKVQRFITGSLNYLLGLYNPFTASIVRQILKKERPNIIHIHNFMGIFSLSILNVLQELKLPVVLTAHDYSLICPKSTIFCYSGLPCEVPKTACKAIRKLQRYLIAEKISMLISPSKFLADQLTKTVFKDVKVIVIPNPSEYTEVKFKKEYDTYSVLYIGRLEWYKGIYVLIKAFKQLNYKNMKMIIVGRGAEEKNIKKISDSHSRIAYYGFVSAIKKRELLQKANITVIPSLWCEPFPIVTLESFRSKTPVIASNIGGLPEIVIDGYNGRLFEPGSLKELKSILIELIKDKEELKKLEEGAFKSAKYYDINKHIAKLEKVYNELAY